MQTKIQQLKKEEAEVEAKVNMYLQKLKHFESTVLLYEKEAARNRVVHVLLIQKRLQHLEAKDDDIVEVNTKPSTAMHIFNKSNCHQLHLHQFIQLQMQMEMPVVNEEMKEIPCNWKIKIPLIHNSLQDLQQPLHYHQLTGIASTAHANSI